MIVVSPKYFFLGLLQEHFSAEKNGPCWRRHQLVVSCQFFQLWEGLCTRETQISHSNDKRQTPEGNIYGNKAGVLPDELVDWPELH